MTASAVTARRRPPSTPLREAAAALRDAEEGVTSRDRAVAHEALRELARTSYRSLSSREADRTAAPTTEATRPEPS